MIIVIIVVAVGAIKSVTQANAECEPAPTMMAESTVEIAATEARTCEGICR